LPDEDRLHHADLRAAGWFFEENGGAGGHGRILLKKGVSSILGEMPGTLSWREEPLLLNYLLHVLMARAQRDAALEKSLLRDVKELFPTFNGYDLLSGAL
jgi:hypothetical protein